MRIYLDTCVWCRPFDKLSPRVREEAEAFLKILNAVSKKEVVIIGSIVLDDEIDRVREDEKREAVKELCSRTVSEKIGNIPRTYRDIMDMTKLKVRDAAHLACALKGSAEYFITADDEILRRSEEIAYRYSIKVCGPMEFLERR